MDERVEFTKQMKKDYTILFPNMAPIQFKLLEKVFQQHGYKMVLLENDGDAVVQEGLKYVHNDTCYPALLVIGQMINALKSGKYDIHKSALLITQTGGGCRASNYIYLLRKALRRAGMGFIPVISLNFMGLEKNSGFKLTPILALKALAAVIFGDELMMLSNQIRPYEVKQGATDKLVDKWLDILIQRFKGNKALLGHSMYSSMKAIANDFKEIDTEEKSLLKVGVVGEIYIKYSKLGNNNLEKFLASQGCEVNVPGLLGFLMYCVENPQRDYKLYGVKYSRYLLCKIGEGYLCNIEKKMYNAVKSTQKFHVPADFKSIKNYGEEIIGKGCKMGEGWLLPAEMVELIHGGYNNIVCTQPFGCLPNHIAGKGMIRKIRELYPQSNIVAIDYDPSATKVNQENRIKLMLAVGKENI